MADSITPPVAGGASSNADFPNNFMTALGKLGIDPNLTLDEVMTPELRKRVLMAEGRERARPRFQQALDRAQRYGYEELRQRIEDMVEADAQRHARRAMKRSGGIGSDAMAAPVAPPARSAASSPVGIDYGAPQFSPISALPPSALRNAPPATGGQSVMASPDFPPMPPTLSGMENPPELTREPFRPRGRVVANLLGAIGGGMGGSAVGGPPGAIAGGGLGSAGAGQAYDAIADWLMGTQERAPILSGDTARDFAAGAIPSAGPIIGAGMRAAGRGAAEIGRAAMSRPTMASALASGALGGAALTATPGGTQQPVEIPEQFRPMDRSAYDAKNRKTFKSLSDLQTEAEERVTKNPAYQGLIEDGRRTQAKRMIDDARAAAKKLYDEERTDREGEEARLTQAYEKYKAGLKTDLDNYFKGLSDRDNQERERRANMPFRRRYPGWAEALPAIGFGIAGGVPFVGRSAANAMTWLPRSASRSVDAATARAEAAANAGDMRNFNIAAGEINNALAARPPSILNQPTLPDAARVAGQAMWPATKAGIAAGPLVAEASMFPDQFDMYNLPPGPAQSEARSNALNPLAYGERAVLGALTGASGYKLPDIIVPRRQPNWARAESAANNPPPGGGGQGGGRGGGQGGGGLPSLVERRARANPNDPRGDWVPRTDPNVPGVTSYASGKGKNEIFLDAGGNWQRRLPNGQTQFLDSRASRALDAGRPPPKYRRVSQAEPGNLLAAYG